MTALEARESLAAFDAVSRGPHSGGGDKVDQIDAKQLQPCLQALSLPISLEEAQVE